MPKARSKRKAGQREPNGRLSRRKVFERERQEMTEREAKSVMIAARARHTGLPAEVLDIVDAGKPNVGTVHGVLLFQQLITRDQWQAAEWYAARREDYRKSILAPGTSRNGPGANSAGHESTEYVGWCNRARGLWAEVMDALQEASTINRSPIISALDTIIVRQHAVEHMIGDLRIGLNVIANRFLAGRHGKE